jgi:hypothetical protein
MAWATLAKTNPYCANDRNAVEDPFHSAEDVCVRCISYLEPDNPSAGSASLLLAEDVTQCASNGGFQMKSLSDGLL